MMAERQREKFDSQAIFGFEEWFATVYNIMSTFFRCVEILSSLRATSQRKKKYNCTI
jgi:hypothetical protein